MPGGELPTQQLNRRQLRRTAVLVVAVVAAGVIGGLLVSFPSSAASSIVRLTRTDAYQLWRLLIAVLLAFSVATLQVSGPAYRSLRRRYPAARLTAPATAYAIGIIVLGVYPAAFGRPDWSWTALTPRVVLIVAIVMGAAWPAVAGLWIVQARARYLHTCTEAELIDHAGERLDEWRAVRRSLARLLALLAAIISLTVIVTGQLRHAQLEAGVATTETFPISYVLLYGAVFAAILAVIYLPVHAAWQRAGERLLDGLYPLPQGSSLPDADWADGRRRLTDYLGLGTTGAAQFRTAFATSAPLLTSLIGSFVPTN